MLHFKKINPHSAKKYSTPTTISSGMASKAITPSLSICVRFLILYMWLWYAINVSLNSPCKSNPMQRLLCVSNRHLSLEVNLLHITLKLRIPPFREGGMPLEVGRRYRRALNTHTCTSAKSNMSRLFYDVIIVIRKMTAQTPSHQPMKKSHLCFYSLSDTAHSPAFYSMV